MAAICILLNRRGDKVAVPGSAYELGTSGQGGILDPVRCPDIDAMDGTDLQFGQLS